jgi:SOS response regulatory protein OraA/RecX
MIAARAAIYARLMEAQARIAQVLYERGIDDAAIQAALDAADERLTEAERRDDLYASTVRHFVETLGGRLEMRAVFEDATITVPDIG